MTDHALLIVIAIANVVAAASLLVGVALFMNVLPMLLAMRLARPSGDKPSDAAR
jgi:hypothetical protein